jgi:hypothetical protein
MIKWLSEPVQNLWIRVVVSALLLGLFGWLAYMAWVAHRDFRIMTQTTTHQFDVLRADHLRAEAAMKTLASQVLSNTQATSKSTEAVKKTTEAVEAFPDK